MFVTFPILVPVKPVHPEGLFQGETDVEILDQPDMFALASPLIYKPKFGGTITIPKGTTTDFASTPKALQSLKFLDINGDSRLAGCLHDGGYRLGRAKGKAFWDSLLRDACLDVGMTSVEAGIYYWGVRMFGKSGWNQDGAHASFGSPNANFIDQASYDAFMASGGTVFSKELA